MPIIRDAIKSGMCCCGVGFFDGFGEPQLGELTKMTRKERRRWWKFHIVPRQVIHYFWGYGVELSPDPPTCGMKLGAFLESLWIFYVICEEKSAKSLARQLYFDTVQSELMPRWRHKLRASKPIIRYGPMPTGDGSTGQRLK